MISVYFCLFVLNGHRSLSQFLFLYPNRRQFLQTEKVAVPVVDEPIWRNQRCQVLERALTGGETRTRPRKHFTVLHFNNLCYISHLAIGVRNVLRKIKHS